MKCVLLYKCAQYASFGLLEAARKCGIRRMGGFFALAALLSLTSCHTSRDFAYLSDAARDSATTIVQAYNNVIRPGDLIYIHVGSQTPESVLPFNQETNSLTPYRMQAKSKSMVLDETGAHQATLSQQAVLDAQLGDKAKASSALGYLVKQDGVISFPVLGSIRVAGLSLDSLGAYLAGRLMTGGYVLDPVVETRLLNFRVTVLGEVNLPSEFHVAGNRLTIFEALALAKDLTLYGRSDNVTVLRDSPQGLMVEQVDLSSKTVLDSPCYYLQSNDIVYVEPNDKRKKVASRDEQLPRYLSTGVATASAANSIYRIIVQLQRQNNETR